MSYQFEAIVLASASPRRREILTQMGVAYTIAEHSVDEVALHAEAPADFVKRLALEKALSVQLAQSQPLLPILGSDTIVVCDEEILGKPTDRADALRMLNLLSGRQHQVYSAVSLCHGKRHEVLLSCSEVCFKVLSEQEIESYWRSEEPLGKAGGYAIQGLGGMFVTDLRGSFSGVMGLPVFETAQLLNDFGVRTGLNREDSK
jgi:septum formation protein